ncbi:MAG: hypothetical protein M3O36_19240 [Myxococcota bacterium]|nr:hypothetical protein [Myxococcota bacterium]
MSGSSRKGRAAAIALLSVAGCVQVLGLHERAESVDGGAAVTASTTDAASGAEASVPGEGLCGKLLHSSPSCASCMDSSCCAEARACAADPACQEASTCLAGCSDAACQARCQGFYALPDTLIALRSCRLRQCATACGSTCGEAASGAIGCQACEQSKCCALESACATNNACAALALCRANCFGATTCPTDCEARFPQGTADFTRLFACTDQCASACQPGQSWACLDGPILWPKPKGSGSITFSVTFVDFNNERPFVGSTVKACDKLDIACAKPIAQSTSDATGTVTLTVPAGLSGFDGYLDVTGGKMDGTGSPAFPSIWYPIPFVVADGWRGRTTTPSADEFPQLAAATGTTLDPTRGHFAANATDCLYTPAALVSYSADAADARTQSFYLVGGVPATTSRATDQSGVGGFINLPTVAPARLVVIKAISGAAGGKSMGAFTFIIRPGSVTLTSQFPPVP